VFTFLGYYPSFSIPPIKRHSVAAAELTETSEIISQSFSKPVILPHPGYLSTRFSNFHPGIDLASGLGMPIHPIIDGEVIEVGHDIFGLGNYVHILHEKGFKSKYAHMGRIFVKKGDKISSDNTIGEVGLTGHTSGPHTHLEITLNDQFIDPLKILPTISEMPTFAQNSSASAQVKN
jgi:murein DD-endopeptidase MepM/ murein hydrolase activator NlpD